MLLKVTAQSAHSILGVSVDATRDEIRAAYRKAALIHHPDRGGDIETFRAKRRAYDQLLCGVKTPCELCGGKGFITTRQGFFAIRNNCQQCWAK